MISHKLSLTLQCQKDPKRRKLPFLCVCEGMNLILRQSLNYKKQILGEFDKVVGRQNNVS